MSNVLLLNAGSSSIKYQVLNLEDESVLASGLVQKIGSVTGSTLDHAVGGRKFHLDAVFPDHTTAFHSVLEMFAENGPSLEDIVAVGHRAVHGGARFDHTVRIDKKVIQALVDLSPLAPLHNPPAIRAIRAAQAQMPDVPHVAVFDTAFFAHLPAESYTYAVDAKTAERLRIRRYGFHGTSHNYVSHRAAEVLGEPYDQLNMIVLHLGNGASISAIKHGQPIDTSMGLTPLEGLVMGTRSGDIDPGLHAYLYRSGMSMDDIDTLLNKKSGLLGLAGVNDMRDVYDKAHAGDQGAKLALDVYVHRLIHYIGAYTALLAGVDALVFTAGVGENAVNIREAVMERMAHCGYRLDQERNAVRSSEPRLISADDSTVKVLVVPTNEELQMAREVKECLGL